MAEMTKEVIVASCKANGGYAAPHLNDQLFLHCKGFTAVRNLEGYRDVKVLWLEQNALSELSGLEGQQDALVSLFVQNNFIRTLTSLTARLSGLRVLNISHNYLTSLRGIAAACPSLETLQASHNQLTSLEVCEELWQLAGTLTSVDLSFNRIETYKAPKEALADASASAAALRKGKGAADKTEGGMNDDDDIHIIDPADGTEVVVDVEAAATVAPSQPLRPAVHLYPNASQTNSRGDADALAVVRFFQRLPLVSVVYMQGNSLSHRLRNYRRNMILHLPTLTYLDERPVFPEERRVVEAWGRGGEDAEAAERAAIREEKRAHLTQCVRVLTEQREGQRELRDRLTAQFEQRRAKELEELVQRRRRERDDRAALEAAEDAARVALEKVQQDGRWDLEEAAEAAQAALAQTESAHRHAYEQHVAVRDATQAALTEAEAINEASQDSLEVNAAAAVKVLEDAGSAADCASVFAPERRNSNGDVATVAVGRTGSAAATRGDAAPVRATKHASSALAELLQSDDDILKEMESEIEHVLYDLNSVGGKSTGGFAARGTHADPVNLTPAGAFNEETKGDQLPAAYSSRQVTDRTTLRMERNVHAAVDSVASQLKAQQRRRSSAQERESVWQRFEQWEARRASLPAQPLN